MNRIKPYRHSFILALYLPIFCVTLPGAGITQEFPIKPITIYCGYAAGASTDLTARALAEGAEKILSVPVIVENKPGGEATVAATLLASKKPDGYTLAAISTGPLTVRPHLAKLAYNPLQDFTPILRLSTGPWRTSFSPTFARITSSCEKPFRRNTISSNISSVKWGLKKRNKRES